MIRDVLQLHPRPDPTAPRRVRRVTRHTAAATHESGDIEALCRIRLGYCLSAEEFGARWTDRVVLVDEEVAGLTGWMETNLRVSWCKRPRPAMSNRRSSSDLFRRSTSTT